MTQLSYAYYDSPIGLVEVGGTEERVNTLYFVAERQNGVHETAVLEQAIVQIREYFEEGRRTFELPLEMGGTDFQKRVWRQLLTVDYGVTASYMDIANALDNPKAIRAVGAANGQNPISIIVPCHRIIGSDGKLTGYGGGLWRKEWLLKHEGALLV